LAIFIVVAQYTFIFNFESYNMTSIKQSFHWLLFFGVTSLLFSCKKDITQTKTDEQNNKHSFFSDGLQMGKEAPYKQSEVILGVPNQNPYTKKNMLLAYTNVISRGFINKTTSQVATTHYYVKFKPQNDEQYEKLKRDTTLYTQDFPIESTIIQNGNKYHDPSLPSNVPTYQYTAVKKNFIFYPDIPYDIIDELYIPEIDPVINGNNNNNTTFIDKLLDQAYIQTGNFADTVKTNIDNSQSRYTPGGTIRIFDTRLNQRIGMEGVIVLARRWFIVNPAMTDINGNYRMPFSFNRPCNYSLWFTNFLFDIREHLFGLTCWINGPKQTGDWNHNIDDGYDRFVGHIFRSVFRYNYKNIGGLQRPAIFYTTGRRQIYIAKDTHKSWSGENWIALPVIRIARYEDEKGSEYDSDEVFSTTCHETGHTSHVLSMNLGLLSYSQVEGQIRESWAVAIEWFLSNIEYRDRGIINYGQWDYHPVNAPQYPNDRAYQYWSLNTDKEYTSMFINIIDNINDSGIFFSAPDDRVTGYSLPFIEANFLRHCPEKYSLAVLLKNNKPVGITDADIDLLLTSY
jgi:hypothetical protein